MKLLDLFLVASMPVLKVLVLTALGLFLALDRVDVLGENARKQLNTVGSRSWISYKFFKIVKYF